ncbi:hypothetical protein M1M52_gp23 [uncultured phage cr54_1]|uniref:Uncharacterized protein n=1 Tax=uncultured phage cr54_1 TaxID=2986398 RepID=A0AAE7RV26_9CAUD|nr:hypothetical protein M1M52_gp23 [uncultured phage cr54_1]QWM89959.1 hypothetical protein [uncultured phage cr54_1]
MGTNISGLGIANAIGFKPRVDGGRRFLPPNIQSSLVSVISTYGKKNTDSDRDTLKDLTGKGNDFKLFNFSFSEASGYGEYKTDFNKNWALEMAAITGNQIVTFNRGDYKAEVFFLKIPTSLKVNIASFTVDVDFKSSKEDAAPYYYYWDTTGKRNQIRLVKGKNVLPTNYASNSTEGTTGSGFHDNFCDIVTIKQIPDFEHWLVTDGNNDFIESIKPMSEMLEGSDSYTVISIIHQIELNSDHSLGLTNYICYNNPTSRSYIRNTIKENDNTGIYGYKVNPTLFTTIKDILGDKNNISINSSGTRSEALNGKFSVVGYRTREGNLSELSKIAYAGTIIANRVLTYDEIYQVIEYYNLDRPGEIIKPSMLYDIRKQGITNVNHAEFNDELIDYINGYNIKMYNMLWDKQSGIGNYPISFKDYTYLPARGTVEINRDSFVITSNTSTANLLEVNTKTKVLPAYKVKIEETSTIKEGNLKWRINTTAAVITYIDIFEDGIYDIPAAPQTEEAAYSGWCISKYNETVNVKVTLLAIDDITDAIVLNGIDNFGKVIDVPIWKDYTICALRKWLYTASVDNGIGVGSLVSKSKVGQDGAFIAEQSFLLNPNKTAGYNFGAGNSSLLNDKINEKSFAIQTKYTYGINRQTLSVGSGLDTNTLWFGTVRDNDTRFSYLALWNLMLFPYTMLNFILERQLKKYKLGSLYPDNSFPFRPVVTANSSTKSIQYFDVVTGKSLAVGDYVAKEQQIQLNIMLNDIDEVIKVTIDGKEVPLYSYNDGYYRYRFNIHNSYPKIDITIQEYVKYDDIVQPYPVIFVLQDKESGKELTYGNYVKVGDIIKVKSVIYYNQDLWSIHGYQIGDDSKIYSHNQLINKDIVVTKPLSFGCIKKWLLSTAEPLFVYDPAIFTNNAIKTLGYLPDISGQNRHLKLYNFSYEGMSGKDGYPVVFGKNKTWENIRPENDNWKYGLSSTGITIYKALDTTPLLYTIIRESGGTIKPISIPSFKINVKGLQDGESIRYRYFSIDNPSTYSNIIITKNGKHELPASVPLQSDSTILDVYIGFQVILNNNESVKGLIIEILPNYEGSLYFDGVNNYGTVQNLDHGGKCLVSKLNYNLKSSIIYDQRSTLDNTPDTNTFALYIGNNNNNVYSERLTGDVYINNVLNNYIGNTDLNNNTHVVTATCSIVDSSNSIGSIFGRSKTGSTYAQFAMYRTILLPEVPNAADREIINKWCGLPTGYLPKPEYYWDVTGKSNSDTATRNTIKNLGTAKPVASTSDEDAYSLENKNVAYEGMSGYNGYPVVFGANKTWETYATYNFTSTINDNKLHITKVLNSNGLIFSYVKRNDELLNIKEIPSFNIKVTGLEGESKLQYFYLSEENAANITILTLENGVHKIPKSLIPTNALPNSTWIGFKITSIQEGVSSFDCDITLEILSEYPNGLCLDGITNYIECANVPAFTDYTYIIKFKDFDDNLYNTCVQYKGPYKQGGSAFIQDYISTDHSKYQLSFGGSNKISNTISVGFCTKTNYNGSTINSGTNSDGLGIVIGKWAAYRKMIFYKEMLWSKSITNTYHINMFRNLINNGGIIDLNDSIFDQTSNE